MNTYMTERSPFNDHMISFLNEMEILGVEIDGEAKVDIILKTLSDSFRWFKLNYSMNKMLMNLPKLMRILHMAKRILKDQRDDHMEV